MRERWKHGAERLARIGITCSRDEGENLDPATELVRNLEPAIAYTAYMLAWTDEALMRRAERGRAP